MSTKIKLKTIHHIQNPKNHNSPDFLPKLNPEVIFIEFDDKQYEVVEMEIEKSNEPEIENVIIYHIKELNAELKSND